MWNRREEQVGIDTYIESVGIVTGATVLTWYEVDEYILDDEKNNVLISTAKLAPGIKIANINEMIKWHLESFEKLRIVWDPSDKRSLDWSVIPKFSIGKGGNTAFVLGDEFKFVLQKRILLK